MAANSMSRYFTFRSIDEALAKLYLPGSARHSYSNGVPPLGASGHLEP
jgi:hypothetical protein